MAECGLLNLGSCLPEKFFEFLLDILNAPVRPFLNLTLNLLSEPINISLFAYIWVIIIYMLSMFYALLLLGAGFSLMISGYDSEKRENAKTWLRNIIIMIILVQASYFIYQLAINLSASMTSATLSLIDENFFLINVEDMGDMAMALFLGSVYVATLILTSLILTIRYAFIAVGVTLFPIGIFLYFFNPLKQYGSLILNVLGVNIFVTFFASILLAGFSKLVELDIFGDMKILVLISAFLLISCMLLFLLIFSMVKAGLGVYNDVKRLRRKV